MCFQALKMRTLGDIYPARRSGFDVWWCLRVRSGKELFQAVTIFACFQFPILGMLRYLAVVLK